MNALAQRAASRRLDAMLTGHFRTTAENAVVVEVAQWSDVVP
jgi:hypothetical protein